MSYELILQRVPLQYFQVIINEILDNNDLAIDKANCALISSEHQFSTSKCDFLMLSSADGSKHRYVYCAKAAKVELGVVLLKEDTYYNIVQSLDGDILTDNNVFIGQIEVKDYFPAIADTLKVAPIHSSCTISTGDDDVLLNAYFSTPRFLHLNDIFSISLNGYSTLNKSVAYYDITEINFKVIAISSKEPTNGNSYSGYYVFKEHSELFCVPPVTSRIPPTCRTILSFTRDLPLANKTSPCLSSYILQLQKLLLPFTKIPKPDCVPFFLLSGTNGCGKLETLKATAEQLGYHILIINCYEFSGVGVSAIEAKLDYLVDKAQKIGACFIAFTDFEMIGKEKSGTEDARLVNSFLQRMNSILKKTAVPYSTTIVGITDANTEDIVPSIARAIVHTIKFQTPPSDITIKTVIWLARQKGFEALEDELMPLTKQLSGFVYADLILLVDHAIRFWNEEMLKEKNLTLSHFKRGLELMDAAYSDAIGAAKVPSVHWDDVGGLVELKQEIMFTLNLPLQRPGLLGGSLRRSGILFYGPPGTGKTLMAKAVATECSMSFLSVKGPELMNMYVGQSERNVREVFERGRAAAPCILFFDELDSLAPNRGKSGDSGGVTDRVVSQLLAEMDGLQSNRGLFVIAATNRPDLVDAALLRPGRFDKMFYLGPCADVVSKTSVLQAVLKKFELAGDVNLETAVALLPSFVTGADVYSVCSNAWLSAARRCIAQKEQGINVELPLKVCLQDFEDGVKAMVPSLTPDDLRYYDTLAASASLKC